MATDLRCAVVVKKTMDGCKSQSKAGKYQLLTGIINAGTDNIDSTPFNRLQMSPPDGQLKALAR
jgi:hypothetical protein